MSNLDLNNPPPGHSFKVAVDRDETQGERSVRLGKEVTLIVIGIVFVGLITWLCMYTLFNSASTPDDRKWAMSVLSGATGGILGYLVRK